MSFYVGDTEFQVKRRILLALHDMSRKLLDASRLLLGMYESLTGGDSDGAEEYRGELAKTIGDIEGYRRSLTRQLAEVGAMLINREDVLRAAYLLEEMASYMDSSSFRIYSSFRYLEGLGKLKRSLKALLEQMLNTVAKMNDLSRMLQVNPAKISDIVSLVEKEEKAMDSIYREALVESLDEIDDYKRLIVFRDVIERIERIADLALNASDMMVIISLRL